MNPSWPPEVLVLERMFHLPARAPAVVPPPSWAQLLAAERRRLTREGCCFVCRRPIARGEDCVVGFLGCIVIHMEPGGRPQPCHETLLQVGKDYSRSRRGRWLDKWVILRHLAARWPSCGAAPPDHAVDGMERPL